MPAFRAVQRDQQKPDLAPPHRVADPLEPGHREAGPAGEADCVVAPPRQQALDTVGELG